MSSQVPPQANPQYPQYPQGPPQPPKKSNVLKWVLIAIALVIVLGGVAVIGVGYFAWQKVKQVGIDPELAQRNPALAAAKVAVAMNPEIEMVAVDEGSGTMTIREKKTGKTIKVNLDDVSKGRISFEDSEGGRATMEMGAKGIEVRTPEGTFTAGEGLTGGLPAWLPAYPGAKAEGSFAMRGAEQRASTAVFQTSDNPAKVADFYEQKLKSAGFKTDRTSVNRSGGPGSMEILNFEGSQGKGAATAVVGDDALTRITLAYEAK